MRFDRVVEECRLRTAAAVTSTGAENVIENTKWTWLR